MTHAICVPDLTARPFEAVVERVVAAAPDVTYRAWTENFDQWFAEPGKIVMRAKVNEPYFFETLHEGQRHPHYGRFLAVEPGRLFRLTWLNEAGTNGAETVLTVELSAEKTGTRIRLTHAGFPTEEMRADHQQAWSLLLEQRLEPLIVHSA